MGGTPAGSTPATVRCRRHGKFWGTVSAGREHYRQVRALGARLIGVGGDVRVMNYGIRELAKAFADD